MHVVKGFCIPAPQPLAPRCVFSSAAVSSVCAPLQPCVPLSLGASTRSPPGACASSKSPISSASSSSRSVVATSSKTETLLHRATSYCGVHCRRDYISPSTLLNVGLQEPAPTDSQDSYDAASSATGARILPVPTTAIVFSRHSILRSWTGFDFLEFSLGALGP